jgi:D-alanyl-D-alanine carboxypeptidase
MLADIVGSLLHDSRLYEKRSRRPLWLGVAVLLSLWSPNPAHAGNGAVSQAERLRIFHEVYADHIASVDADFIKMSNGTEIPISDGKQKSHDEKLARADIEDMLSQVYPVSSCLPLDSDLPKDFDPGRIRSQSFFDAIYGKTNTDVQKNLVTVDWFGQSLKVSRIMGAADQLGKVKAELGKANSDLRPHLTPSAGAFVWRTIAGTSRISAHGYGIAIDIATAKTDYWQWAKFSPERIPAVRKKVPQAIIDAFERHGFIWGGNWYHFDTMHFEYRPELVAIGRLAKSRGCARP